MKWVGYNHLTWTPGSALSKTAALNQWETRTHDPTTQPSPSGRGG
ncbi:hypothetical protein GX50_04414 [[Emmonsia] crescens]|uniref:Uncharacterized protein n=1 Tax=[Emmonsia] crescens TaxID=73230 RepID=A0A2B7ZI17_9EURO|nr:hypothetical protein GX50_04414 [Emmonsia crescens]